MIKVKFDDYEVVEVSGDLKDVKKFVKSYTNEMDDELPSPFSYIDDDFDVEDEDDEFDMDACDEEEPEVSHKLPFRDVVKEAVDTICDGIKGNTEKANEDEEDDAGDEPEFITAALTALNEMLRKAVAESEKDENTKDVKEDKSLDISKYSALTTDPDFKVRLRAEYHEVRIRLIKLLQMLDKWKKGELNFTPKCSRALLTDQVKIMERYLSILEVRAGIEGVEL